MTWALCFNCGEVKFGALRACPRCEVGPTGNVALDMTFSDHHLEKETLEEFGAVIAAIHEVSDDDQQCFWSFIRYVSADHPEIITVKLEADVQAECDAVLARASLPEVTVRRTHQEE